jgi:hypothetical protein
MPFSLSTSRLLRAGLMLLVVAALTYWIMGRVWSGSVDLAHHYALVVRLAEYANGAFPLDPSLGEMNVYPRLSHQLAVVAGSWADSPMQGMQLVAALGVVTVWAGLAWLVATLPPPVAWRAGLALLVLLVLNGAKARLSVHGVELVAGYFYAQLVGQAVLVAALVASLYLERRQAPYWLRYALLVPVIYLLTGIHLLPALFLLMLMGWLVVADLLVQVRTRQAGMAVRSAVGAGLLLCALGMLVSHPGFATMRQISRSNGGIDVRYFNSPAALVALAVVVALASAGLLWFWMRRHQARAWLPLKYLALYGLAVSCLALVQGVALKFGLVSDYALRKYAFALVTMALILLALLPGLLSQRRASGTPASAPGAPMRRAARWWYYGLPAVLVVVACLAVPRKQPLFGTGNLVAIEQAVMGLKKQMGAPPDGQFDYVLGTQMRREVGFTVATPMAPAATPPVLEYMYSIGHLHIPRGGNPNAHSLLFEHNIADWSLVARLVTAAGSAYDQVPACRTGMARGGLVVLDGACLRQHGKQGSYIDLTSANRAPACTLTGFGAAEPDGSWTVQRQATLRCPRLPVNGKAPRRVALTAVAYRDDEMPQQVRMAADGLPATTIVYKGGGHLTVPVPLRDSGAADVLITLDLPDAMAPVPAGAPAAAADPRLLGLYVRGVSFSD